MSTVTATDWKYKGYMGKSLGRSRDTMPQIDGNVLDNFLIHFSGKASVKKVDRKLSQLKPAQNEINEDKLLDRLKNKSEDYKSRNYIISSDNYLIDGHHDWAHGLEHDADCMVKCYRVNLKAKELLRRSNLMKITGKRDLQDQDLKKAEEFLLQDGTVYQKLPQVHPFMQLLLLQKGHELGLIEDAEFGEVTGLLKKSIGNGETTFSLPEVQEETPVQEETTQTEVTPEVVEPTAVVTEETVVEPPQNAEPPVSEETTPIAEPQTA